MHEKRVGDFDGEMLGGLGFSVLFWNSCNLYLNISAFCRCDFFTGCYCGFIYVLRSSDGEVHWTFKTEDSVKSSPAVDPSTGLVFIGSHDQHVYALDIYVSIEIK